MDSETHQCVNNMHQSVENRGISPEQTQNIATRMESGTEVSSYATADDIAISDVPNSDFIDKKEEACTSGQNQIKIEEISNSATIETDTIDDAGTIADVHKK